MSNGRLFQTVRPVKEKDISSKVFRFVDDTQRVKLSDDDQSAYTTTFVNHKKIITQKKQEKKKKESMFELNAMLMSFKHEILSREILIGHRRRAVQL